MTILLFLIGLILGGTLGYSLREFPEGKHLREFLRVTPGVILENKMLAQALWHCFPPPPEDIFVNIDDTQYRLFKENNEIKYVLVPKPKTENTNS